MADVRPIRDPLRPRHRRVPRQGRRAALRRDRHRPAGGAAGALAVQRGRDRPAKTVRRDRPDRDRATTPTSGRRGRSMPGARGGAGQDTEPAIWAMTQDYTGARRRGPHPPRDPCQGPGRGLRGGPGPPPRAHPAGPEEDRLDLTRATRHNLSPIFSLATATPGRWSRPRSAGEPWGEATDETGTVDQGLAGR